MAVGNSNFDIIASTTYDNYRTTLADNIFTAMPILKYLQVTNNITEQGGRRIVQPLMYAQNTTIDWLTKYGIINTDAQDGISAAEFPWSHLAGSVVVSNIEIDVENASDEQIISLLKAKMTQAELSIRDKIYDQLWGAKADATQMWSLVDVVDASDPTFGDFGNIDRTDNTWWAATEINSAGNVLTLSAVNHLYNTCADGTDTPDLIVMGQDLYEKFEGLLVANMRYGDERFANSGIETLRHKGATVMLDKGCTAEHVYCLNSKYLQLVVAKGRNFKITKFMQPVDQDARVAQILWSGNLTCSNCKRQGKDIHLHTA